MFGSYSNFVIAYPFTSSNKSLDCMKACLAAVSTIASSMLMVVQASLESP